MARLNLPDTVRDGFKELLSLTGPAFDALVEQLSKADLELSPNSVIKRTAKGLNVSAHRAQHIWFALYFLHSAETVSPAKIVADVVESLGATAGDERAKIQQRAKRLLEIAPLSVLVKSMGLLVRNVNNFTSSRAVTDLRPTFTDVQDKPTTFVLIHELDITYQDNTAGEESALRHFFVALDDADLDDLISSLKRCKQKADSLKAHLRNSGLSFLATERES
ncbi:MAG: hypothetical protein WB681_00690 [Candidatus Cybelea sp.]